MDFYYRTVLAHHWNSLVEMIRENYQTDENENGVVHMATYLHQPADKLREETVKSNQKLIIYQLEPLVENQRWKIEHIVNNIKGADEIWDYDLQNIELLQSYGIEAKFKPILYTNAWNKIPKKECDIDILFYGSVSDHRNKFFSDFSSLTLTGDNEKDQIFSCLKIVKLEGIADGALDDFIARSKIILNLSQFSGEIRQQQTRIAYALNNNKLVISQKAPINYFGDSIVQFETPNQFRELVVDAIQNDKWKHDYLYKRNIFNRAIGKKIAIFYHIYQAGDWKRIFYDQILELQKSGLYDQADYIHIGVNGRQPLPFNMNKVNRVKYNVNIDLESDTLSDLHKFSKHNPDYKILYIHAKGVSWDDRSEIKKNIELWRKYIEYFTIQQWNRCYNLLKDHDCVGTEWETESNIGGVDINIPHYAGNFWWANASYIKTLDPSYIYQENNWKRWNGEFWIGTGNPKHYNFYFSNKNKYLNPLTFSEYSHY